MQFSTVFLTVVAAAAGLVSAEEPTTTTTLTSTLTQTVTITSCNPTVSNCPALLATATAAAVTSDAVEAVTTSSAYVYTSSAASHSYPPHGSNSTAHTTVLTSVGGPHSTSTAVVPGTTGAGESGVPTGAAAGLRAEHGLVAAVIAAGVAALF
jgi:hypothetical protein